MHMISESELLLEHIRCEITLFSERTFFATVGPLLKDSLTLLLTPCLLTLSSSHPPSLYSSSHPPSLHSPPHTLPPYTLLLTPSLFTLLTPFLFTLSSSHPPSLHSPPHTLPPYTLLLTPSLFTPCDTLLYLLTVHRVQGYTSVWN